MKKIIILAMLIASYAGAANAYSPVRLRNVCYIYISEKSDSMVYCCDRWTTIDQLKDLLKQYVANIEGEEFEAYGVGMLKEQRAIIALQTTRGAMYKTYFSVQNEISKAYNELRDEMALKLWSCSYNQLKPYQQEAVCRVYPMIVSDTEPRYRP